MINRNKYEWETLNTSKIKTVFNLYTNSENDYGTKLRIKCHQRIERKVKTIEDELCTNWELIDNFGVRLDFTDNDKNDNNDGYNKFYDNPVRWNINLVNGFYKMFTLVKNCWTVYEA